MKVNTNHEEEKKEKGVVRLLKRHLKE